MSVCVCIFFAITVILRNCSYYRHINLYINLQLFPHSTYTHTHTHARAGVSLSFTLALALSLFPYFSCFFFFCIPFIKLYFKICTTLRPAVELERAGVSCSICCKQICNRLSHASSIKVFLIIVVSSGFYSDFINVVVKCGPDHAHARVIMIFFANFCQLYRAIGID